MLFLAGCCFCYGALMLLWLLKGCLSNDVRHGRSGEDRHGRSGENQSSEHDDAGVPVHFHESAVEKNRSKSFKTGRGKVKGGFTRPKPPIKSLNIERKVFCASNLLPGRMTRVTERLFDRSYSVDLYTNELSWLTVALRDASVAKSCSFCKQFSMGSRSLELISESNRAGVVLKLVCALGGRNRRFLFFPAGKNREGWGRLSKFLAAVAKGGKVWVKKPLPPSLPSARAGSFQHQELSEPPIASSIGAVRGKDIILPCLEDSGWKEGFLPDMLKHGLKLCLGTPSSSGEANRSFAWRTYQSELGSGTVVVEQLLQRDASLGRQNYVDMIERGSDVSLAGGVDDEHVGTAAAEEEFSVHGEEEDVEDVLLSDADADSILGNLIPKDKIFNLSYDAQLVCSDFYLAGGPSTAVLEQDITSESREELSLDEQSGSVKVWAEVIHAACALELLGPGYERAEEALSLYNLGGLAAGSALKSFQSETIGKGPFRGNNHFCPDGSPASRFLAKVEDITIFDNEESLSFDSPVSDFSSRVAEESIVEEGVSCTDDLCVICGSIEPCGGSGGYVRW